MGSVHWREGGGEGSGGDDSVSDAGDKNHWVWIWCEVYFHRFDGPIKEQCGTSWNINRASIFGTIEVHC